MSLQAATLTRQNHSTEAKQMFANPSRMRSVRPTAPAGRRPLTACPTREYTVPTPTPNENTKTKLTHVRGCGKNPETSELYLPHTVARRQQRHENKKTAHGNGQGTGPILAHLDRILRGAGEGGG